MQYFVFHRPKYVPPPQVSSNGAVPVKKQVNLTTKRKATSDTQPAKRIRYDSKPKTQESTQVAPKQAEEVHVATVNIYTAMSEIFNKFWEIEIDPLHSTPFFALITRYNCGPVFNMPDYFDKVIESCTLANIKVNIVVLCSNISELYIFVV